MRKLIDAAKPLLESQREGRNLTPNETKFQIEVTQVGGGTPWIIDNDPANPDGSASYTVTGLTPKADSQDPPPNPGSPYFVALGGMTTGSTSFSHHSGELTLHPALNPADAASPEAAVTSGVITGTITIDRGNNNLHSFTFPGEKYRVGTDGPGDGFDGLPLKWNPMARVFTGRIGLEDSADDSDFDDWFWDVSVYPNGSIKPALSVTATDATAAEEMTGQTADVAKFTITRQYPAGWGNIGALDVPFHPLAGEASWSNDYTLFVGGTEIVPTSAGNFSVTMPAGQTQVLVEVRPVDDILMEAAEKIQLYPMAAAAYLLQTSAPAPATTQSSERGRS